VTLSLARWADLGEGSALEKRPGVVVTSVAVVADMDSGRTVQRPFWFNGALEDTEERRRPSSPSTGPSV
jgi:hypothetical protein